MMQYALILHFIIPYLGYIRIIVESIDFIVVIVYSVY